MDTIQTLFPQAEDLLVIAPEDLAPLLLRLARGKVQSGGMFWPDSVADEIRFVFTRQPNEYSHNRKRQVKAALSESWNWLRTSALIAPAPGMNGGNGWMIITRSGEEISDDEGFERFRAAKAFPKALLHPTIADKVWSKLARGDLAEAAFIAFRTVRNLSGKRVVSRQLMLGPI